MPGAGALLHISKVSLERVIGLTVRTNATLTCDLNTGTIAYPAGCVVVLFDHRSNKQSYIFNTCRKTITAVAFSPDGKLLVTGENGNQPAVRVWDVAEKIQVTEFHGHKFGIVCVKFSPSENYVVSIGSEHDMMVNVWNWKKKIQVASNKIISKVNSMSFSKDGSMFVTVGHRHVKFWYLRDTKSKINQTVPLQGSSGILRTHFNNFYCDVSCGHAVYAITQSGLLCQFNEKRELDKFVELQTTTAYCIAAGKDHIFVGCANGVVQIFDVNLQYVATMPHPHWLGVDVALPPNSSQLHFQTEDAKFPDAIAISYDDVHRKVTCVYNDHSLYVWDVHDVMNISKSCSFLYHSSGIWGLEVNPATTEEVKTVLQPGSFLTCSSDDTIRIWNLDPHLNESENSKHNAYSNELLKVVYVDPTLTFLKDVPRKPADEGKSGIRSIAISPDGRHLVSGDRIGNIRIHDLTNMEEIIKIEAHDQEILCVQYSNLSTGPQLLASGSRDRLIHVFDVEKNYCLMQTLDDHSSSVTSIKFTENNNQIKMLSSSADKSVLFRDAQMSPELQFVIANQHVVGTNTLYDIDIDSTQKLMATACQDRNIRIYNIETVKQMQCYKGALGMKGVLLKLQLDPSSQYLVTSCSDKSLCLLDFKTGHVLATMIGHSEQVYGVKFMPDLKRLVSVSTDGCLFVWRLPREVTESMRVRLQEMGRLPMEAIEREINRNSGECWNRTYRVSDPAPLSLEKALEKVALTPNEHEVKTYLQEELQTQVVTTPLSIKEDSEASRKEEPLDFNNTIAGLPDWLQAKMGKDISSPKEPDTQLQLPVGRWAVRDDSVKLWLAGKKGPCVEGEPQVQEQPSSMVTLPVEDLEDNVDLEEKSAHSATPEDDHLVKPLGMEMEEKKTEKEESLNSLNPRVSLSSKYWSKSQLENISNMTMQICMQQQNLLNVKHDRKHEELSQQTEETIHTSHENKEIENVPDQLDPQGTLPQEMHSTPEIQPKLQSEQDFDNITIEKEDDTLISGNQEDELSLRREMVNTLKELLEATRENGRLLTMLDSSIKKNTMVLQSLADSQRSRLREESC